MRCNNRDLVLLLLLAAVTIVAGCGQKPQVHMTGDDRGSLLPVECEGDPFHCDVLTSFRDVNVYRNSGPTGYCSQQSCIYPPSRYGTRWQCVELFNRFFATQFGIEPVAGHARDLLANAASTPGLEVRPNGGKHPPGAGDALVFGGTSTGHVAIIVKVTATQVHVVEQNASADGRSSHDYDPASHTVAVDGSAMALGWIHATANEAAER